MPCLINESALIYKAVLIKSSSTPHTHIFTHTHTHYFPVLSHARQCHLLLAKSIINTLLVRRCSDYGRRGTVRRRGSASHPCQWQLSIGSLKPGLKAGFVGVKLQE